MKRFVLFSFVSLVTASSFATISDLSLPGEKWIAKFNGYVCDDKGASVRRPAALETINVNFERMTTDMTLDNALLKATFEENGQTCRYNVILFADNAARTSTIVQSIAFLPEGGATAYRDCAKGKAVLDAAFAHNEYLYYGHPHNLAFMLPGVGSEELCNGSGTVGAAFVVAGKIQPLTAK